MNTCRKKPPLLSLFPTKRVTYRASRGMKPIRGWLLGNRSNFRYRTFIDYFSSRQRLSAMAAFSWQKNGKSRSVFVLCSLVFSVCLFSK